MGRIKDYSAVTVPEADDRFILDSAADGTRTVKADDLSKMFLTHYNWYNETPGDGTTRETEEKNINYKSIKYSSGSASFGFTYNLVNPKINSNNTVVISVNFTGIIFETSSSPKQRYKITTASSTENNIAVSLPNATSKSYDDTTDTQIRILNSSNTSVGTGTLSVRARFTDSRTVQLTITFSTNVEAKATISTDLIKITYTYTMKVSGTNANELPSNTIYRITSNEIANDWINLPVKKGALIITFGGSINQDRRYQMFWTTTAYDGDRIYVRNERTGTWSDWKRIMLAEEDLVIGNDNWISPSVRGNRATAVTGGFYILKRGGAAYININFDANRDLIAFKDYLFFTLSSDASDGSGSYLPHIGRVALSAWVNNGDVEEGVEPHNVNATACVEASDDTAGAWDIWIKFDKPIYEGDIITVSGYVMA